jgi:hypothetical protein
MTGLFDMLSAKQVVIIFRELILRQFFDFAPLPPSTSLRARLAAALGKNDVLPAAASPPNKGSG